MTYYDTDEIHVKCFTGITSVKVTEWNGVCETTLYFKDVRTGVWKKTRDRQPIWDFDIIDR